MAVFMLIGYLLYKKGKITKEGSASMAQLLVNVIIPTTMITSFAVEKTPQKMREFWICLALTVGVQAIALVISRLLFQKKPIQQFAAAFSNAGFIGIPLIQACFGTEAVFYLVWYLIILNVLQWTYGSKLIVSSVEGAEKPSVPSLKNLLLSPIILAAAIGTIVFVTGAGGRLPSLVRGTLESLSVMNGPLAMIVLGVYLAQSDLLRSLTDKTLILTCLVRLVVIPAVLVLFLGFLPVDPTLRMAVFIAGATPAGANVAVYAQIYGADYPGACRIVTLSTILSIVILPVMIAFASVLIH